MKKIANILVFALLFSLVLQTAALGASYAPDFEVKSEAAILMNLETGTVIYEKNADKKMYPASLTKLMTAIVTLETNPDLTAEIKAKHQLFDEFQRLTVSNADIWPGETMDLESLLYAMMLRSANEAANMVADHLGGGIENFVSMMNLKAREIGCTGTNFENVHGLFNPNHFTTARDFTKILSHALDLEYLVEIMQTTEYTLPKTKHQSRPVKASNTNFLLDPKSAYYYPETILGKTGYLSAAGRCFASAAKKDGFTYLLVLLNAPATDENGKDYAENFAFTDSIHLFDWAFNEFQEKTVLSTGESYGKILPKHSSLKEGEELSLNPRENIRMLVPKNLEITDEYRTVVLSEEITAPVEKGQVLGKLTLAVPGHDAVTVELLAQKSVEMSVLKYISFMIGSFFKRNLWRMIVVLLLIAAAVFLWRLHNLSGKKRRKKRQPYKRG